MIKRPLAIGVDNYKNMIDNGYYYVDKTLLMKELLDKKGSVNLFTRPRRFGKTLSLSMLKTYFECEINREGQYVDNSRYFTDKKIMDAGEAYTKHLGQYPVIFMSLKSAKQPTFEMAYASLVDEISREYNRHNYILTSDAITAEDKEMFLAIRGRKAEEIEYAKSFAFLSQVLEIYHEQKTIILLDEYDVPLENSHFRGFYTQMIDFIRSLFESALKTNDSLAFAVITGCLRISKESIFTGLNNLEIISVLNDNYAEHFGFTQKEVERMLVYYQISERNGEVRQWYDGYIFGSTEVYNPWSVINYVKTAVTNKVSFPKPYWSNTSSNSIIREMVEQAGGLEKQELEALIEGNTIEKPVHEDITYEDIHKTQDNLWNFLFFTGYLKMVSQRLEGDTIYLTLEIPNAEVRYIYRNTIREWFEQKVNVTDLSNMYHAVVDGDADTFGMEVTRQLGETISFFDYAENYYHGFLTGLLKGCPQYIVLSNRESGNGRPDLIMKTVSVRGMAIILEIKVVKEFDDMEKGCDEALQQIEEGNYQAELYREGYRNFMKYGICFYRKECLVKKG